MTDLSLLRPLRRLMLALLLLPALTWAQPSTNFVQRLSELEKAVSQLGATVRDQQARLDTQDRRLTEQANAITALNTALSKEIADRSTYADGVGANALATAKAYSDNKLAPVSDKLRHFSRSGNDVFITGANLHVRNGLGATVNNGYNGLGNLVVGYNESRGIPSNPDVRTGSHNLIVGAGANFARSASIITGVNNGSANNYASVLGGTGNVANATYSVVVGGYNNQTNGGWATILGGRDRVAGAQLDHLP